MHGLAIDELGLPLTGADVLKLAPAPQITTGTLKHLVLVTGLCGVMLGLQDRLGDGIGDLKHRLQVSAA